MLNLEKNKHYLLACSFGPDSMALFDMLLKEGYKFTVAHVNYHLRKESNEEEALLRDFCFNHNIGIYVKDVDENLGESNLEKKCRDIRYNFFIDVIKNNGFDALLIAHQEDDLIGHKRFKLRIAQIGRFPFNFHRASVRYRIPV